MLKNLIDTVTSYSNMVRDALASIGLTEGTLEKCLYILIWCAVVYNIPVAFTSFFMFFVVLGMAVFNLALTNHVWNRKDDK